MKDYKEYLEEVQKTLQFQMGAAAAPGVLLITNISRISGTANLWDNVLATISITCSIAPTLYLGVLIWLARDYRSEYSNPNKRDDLNIPEIVEWFQDFDGKVGPIRLIAVIAAYVAAGLCFMILLWSCDA